MCVQICSPARGIMLKPDLNFGSITVHSSGLQYCLLSPQQLCKGIGIRSLFSITRFVFLFSNPLCTCSVSWPSPACDSVLLGSSWRVFQFCSCLNYLANFCVGCLLLTPLSSIQLELVVEEIRKVHIEGEMNMNLSWIWNENYWMTSSILLCYLKVFP